MLDETGKEIELGVSDEERSKRRAVLDKTTGKDLERGWQEKDREEIAQREESIAPPPINEPRCATCQSPNRLWIEHQLIKGRGYQTISNALPADADGNKPSRKSIAAHRENHMPIDRMVIRHELEQAADLLNQNYETGAEGALTTKGMINVIVQKAYDDYIKGMTTAEVKDIVQLVKLLNEMNSSTAQIKNEEAELIVRTFILAIQNTCDANMQQEIGQEVKRLRTMDDISLQMENHLSGPIEIPEATVVDDT